MKHIGIFKPDTLVTILNYVGLPLAAIYFYSMFIYPFIDSDFNWGDVQNVWGRWQGLNVGMLAFVSSITAFNISRFNANKQRERDFLATKAFLPAALSELCAYFKSSAAIFIRAWELQPNNRLDAEAPELPESYKKVFGDCIRHAEPDVGDYLTTILMRLQVHNSRMHEFVRQFDDRDFLNPDKYNLITYFYRLAELQAWINKIYPFARNMEPFDSTPLEWEDFKNALGNMDVWIEDIHIDESMNLEAFIKRAIDRNET